MLPECAHPPAGTRDVSELVKLLSSLVCLHLKEQGSCRPAGPRRASGKAPAVPSPAPLSFSHSWSPLGGASGQTPASCWDSLRTRPL